MNVTSKDMTLNELLTLPRKAITRVISTKELLRVDFE